MSVSPNRNTSFQQKLIPILVDNLVEHKMAEG